MKYVIISSIILFSLLINSCGKDEDDNCDNPQLPGEYFPAYPNSYWKYTTNEGKTVEYKISEKYEDCKEGCRPIFLNTNSCIHGNELVDSYSIGEGIIGILNSPIYTTILDSTFLCPHSFATLTKMDVIMELKDIIFERTLINNDTTISINSNSYSNVIIIKEIDKRDKSYFYYDFFAKDIGLIKRDLIEKDTTAINTTTIMEIESYSIGEK